MLLMHAITIYAWGLLAHLPDGLSHRLSGLPVLNDGLCAPAKPQRVSDCAASCVKPLLPALDRQASHTKSLGRPLRTPCPDGESGSIYVVGLPLCCLSHIISIAHPPSRHFAERPSAEPMQMAY